MSIEVGDEPCVGDFEIAAGLFDHAGRMIRDAAWKQELIDGLPIAPQEPRRIPR